MASHCLGIVSASVDAGSLGGAGFGSAVSDGVACEQKRRDAGPATLGAAALEWLFHQTAHAWCRQDAERHDWQGLSLWAMDGTTFRTPDSADNRAHFWRPSVRERQGRQLSAGAGGQRHGHPHAFVSDIAFGEYGQNEMLYAKTLIKRHCRSFPHRLLTGAFSVRKFVGANPVGPQSAII